MKTILRARHARCFAAVVGAMDFATGAGLLFFPTLTLSLMHVDAVDGQALTFLRFAGVFVAGVGLSYAWALWAGGEWRLRAVFELTIIFRTGAGLFMLVAVVTGLLEPAWLTVSFVDLTIATLQTWWLRQPAHDDE